MEQPEADDISLIPEGPRNERCSRCCRCGWCLVLTLLFVLGLAILVVFLLVSVYKEKIHVKEEEVQVFRKKYLDLLIWKEIHGKNDQEFQQSQKTQNKKLIDKIEELEKEMQVLVDDRKEVKGKPDGKITQLYFNPAKKFPRKKNNNDPLG